MYVCMYILKGKTANVIVIVVTAKNCANELKVSHFSNLVSHTQTHTCWYVVVVVVVIVIWLASTLLRTIALILTVMLKFHGCGVGTTTERVRYGIGRAQ